LIKTIIITLLVLTTGFGLELQVETQIYLGQTYSLSCSDARGQVSYHADNLPQGVRLRNDRI
jgi:hypothetical protein